MAHQVAQNPFGISPFGIGRPERRPPGITGFSQYDKLYADVEGWLAQGWLDYLANDPAPGNALILADNPDMTEDFLISAIAKMNEYKLATAGASGVGAMTDERWRDFFTVMSANGVYKTSLDVKKAYTLDFLPKS